MLRKFLLCITTGLVCSMTVLRIGTRLAFERGVDTHAGPPIIVLLPAVLVFLTCLIYPFIRKNIDTDAWRFLLCYGIGLNLTLIGLQKWFDLQAHLHIALL